MLGCPPSHGLLWFFVILCGSQLPLSAHSAERPNVLVILVDDLGYGDLTCYGAPDLQTPEIDQLFSRGMKFQNAYANSPVCSPTRASLLTGRYPDLVGVPGVIRTHPDDNWGKLDVNAILMPQLLAESGYDTALIGKWHLGLTEEDHPLARGFAHFEGFLGDMMDDYYDHQRHGINYMRNQRETIEPTGHATDLFTEWACRYLRQRADANRPFFLYLAYNAPHTPIQPPDDWLDRVRQREPAISQQRAKLVALIEHLDHGIGRVLDALTETGLDNNTLVVFTSDNGGQLNVGCRNGALRDGKGSMYEGGLKVPACVVWPDRVAADTRTERTVVTMDWFPTICELVGIDLKHAVDGQSCASLLLAREEASSAKNSADIRDLFFVRREGGMAYNGLEIRALRRGSWKLVQNSPYAPWQLFDLDADPLEEHDVSKQESQRFQQLSAAMRQQIQRAGAVPWQE